ncbi:MAG: hypothetical protein DI598_02020 [Pseudopedobacter saltans]|uniref:DUF502 domain-containing protein n=1 Tax=Pseudopedobacter saltans TaxID=151895 RepID=A0A2W5HE14_9SPHI|nr:MAG: hypothetical protein DI598_02020 [Pseudopedobacter saltans]
MPLKKKDRPFFSAQSLVQYLFQGILVIAPVAVTVYVIWWLFTLVDNLLPNIISNFIPSLITENGTFKRIPGVGFVITILFLVLVGRLSSIFIVEKLMHFFDRLLEHTPGVKIIYSSVKDFVQAFAGNKKKFNKPVMVNVDAQDIWRLGFITQEDASSFGLNDYVVVYVPHSYALSGITYLVPKDKIKKVSDDVKAADVMKFVVSGGVTDVDHHTKNG